MKIPIMEIFGPTIQGEGMVIGQKTMFVRTGGCDYSCSWCDSKFTWDGTGKTTLMKAPEIINALKEIGGDAFSHITISGGNPALHKGLGDFINQCHEQGWKVAVETQGSFWQDWLTDIDDVTISPKPPSSLMTTDFNKLDIFMNNLIDSNLSLKVVIFDEDDFNYAEMIHVRYPHTPFFLQVGNDDVLTVDDQALVSSLLKRFEWLVALTMKSTIMNDAKVLPQLHALIWGNKRGV